jgi:hypothetical protein
VDIITLSDKNGVAKSITQWFREDTKNEIIAKVKGEQLGSDSAISERL